MSFGKVLTHGTSFIVDHLLARLSIFHGRRLVSKRRHASLLATVCARNKYRWNGMLLINIPSPLLALLALMLGFKPRQAHVRLILIPHHYGYRGTSDVCGQIQRIRYIAGPIWCLHMWCNLEEDEPVEPMRVQRTEFRHCPASHLHLTSRVLGDSPRPKI